MEAGGKSEKNEGMQNFYDDICKDMRRIQNINIGP